MQIQQGGGAPQKYNGMVDCAKQLYKEGGIRSVYKGSFATLLRGKQQKQNDFFIHSKLIFCTDEFHDPLTYTLFEFNKKIVTSVIGLYAPKSNSYSALKKLN